MADISLGLRIDIENIAEIKKALDEISKASVGGGGGATVGAAKVTNEFAESLAKIKVAARDAETEFRRVAIAERDLAKEAARGTASLEQLQKAQEATKAAQASATSVIAAQEAALRDLGKESGRSAIELDKISIATKSMVEAQQRVKVGFVGMATALDDINSSTKAANNVLLEFGRGVGDAGMFALDFRMGLLAVGNNITQTADSMGRLISQSKAQAVAMHGVATATNTAKIAFSSLATSFMGANGIIFLINAAVTALTIWSQTSKKAADEGTDYLAEAIGRLRGEFDRVNSAISDAQSKLGMIGGGDIEKTEAALERARKALAEQQAILENIDALDKERLKAAKEESRSLNEQLVSLSKKDPEYRKHEERAYTQLNLVKQLESGSTSVRLEQAKTVAAISQSVTQLEEKLKAQKQIKAVLGDEVDLIGEAEAKEKARYALLQFRNQEMLRLKQIVEDISVIEDEISVPNVNTDLTSPYGTNQDRLSRGRQAEIALQVQQNLEIAQNQNKAFASRREAASEAYNLEIQALKETESFKTATVEEQEHARYQIKKKYADLNKQIDRDQIQAFHSLLSLSSTVMNSFADLANQRSQQLKSEGKTAEAKAAFERAKKLSIAQALTYTYLGAASAYAQTPGGPIIKGFAAAAATAAGLANVERIRRTKYDDGDYRGGANGRFGTTQEGFRTDPVTTQTGGATALSTTSSIVRQPTQIVIQSQLNQDVLAYNVRQGEAIIRQQTTIVRSDAA